MAAVWSWILAFLVWLSAGDMADRDQAPKAAAAVAAARASMTAEPPPPAPKSSLR